MIEKFLESILGIKEYKIKLYNSGKDNITYEISTNSGDVFIVQKVLSNKSQKNIEFIENIISFTNKNNDLLFAKKYGNNRFIKFEKNLFQVMKKVNGKTIHEKDININLIKNTAKYIALFHNHIDNFEWKNYEEINYFKKMHDYRLEVNKLLNNESVKITHPCPEDTPSDKFLSLNSNGRRLHIFKIREIFIKMNDIAKNLRENHNLPKGIIHGDPSFKNFLIDENENIVGLIDYDMLSVNNYLWDLADMIRSYMKSKVFNKKEFEILINSYNGVRKLSDLENKELKNYCKMMILDTGFRYLLSCFESDNHNNLLGNKDDSICKAERCLNELKKLESFYN